MTCKPPPAATQPLLFDLMPDKPLRTPGESRTRYGRVVEEIACALLGLQDIPNSGDFQCVYDAYGLGSYCEIKSVRAGSKIPLYEWRRFKDAESGVDPIYVILVHRCTSCKTLGEVWGQMTRTIRDVYVLPSREMSRLACLQPLTRILETTSGKQRQGYSRKGYSDGYRNVPINGVHGIASREFAPPVNHECVIYGLPVRADVHFYAI